MQLTSFTELLNHEAAVDSITKTYDVSR